MSDTEDLIIQRAGGRAEQQRWQHAADEVCEGRRQDGLAATRLGPRAQAVIG